MTKLGWRSPESSNLCNFDQIEEAFGGIIAMGPWGRAGVFTFLYMAVLGLMSKLIEPIAAG